MWVVFEGLDKAGKTTLEWELLKATNFKHVVIDRGPAGYLVFDTLFNRATEENVEQYMRNVKDMKDSGNFLVVYCKAPYFVAKQRLREHNETCPYDYMRAQGMYDASIKQLYEEEGIKVITVDTIKTIKECVDLIKGALE